MAIGGEESFSLKIAAFLGLWAGLVPGVFIVCRFRGVDVRRDLQLRFERVDAAFVFVGPACQWALVPLYSLLETVSGKDLSKEVSESADTLVDGVHGAGLLLLVVLVVAGAPLIEELFYRGLLLRGLRRRFSPWAAIVVSGVVFGLVHFEPIAAPGLALFGMFLAYLAHRTGRLGPSIVTHASFNAMTMLALVLEQSK